MTNDLENNDLQTIISQILDTLKAEQGSSFSLENVNLAEMEKLTGISRGRLRKIKKDGFVILPHGNKGRKAAETVLTGFTGVLDNLLRNNVTNSVVCYERLQEQGYQGSLTTVKVYISNHKDLIPPKRQVIAPQGSRGRRYSTGPGESYQMDWGFISMVKEVENYHKFEQIA